MGEYAKRISDNQEVKIGTCETMYYLRYEDRHKVEPLPGNVDPRRATDLFWRLPFPEEDAILLGDYEPFKSERLWSKDDVIAQDLTFPEEPGIIQFHHSTGLLINVPCHHGKKLPEPGPGMQTFWNGKGPHLALVFIKNCKDGSFRPVVECVACRHMASYDWPDIEPYVHGELHDRLQRLCTK